MVNNFSAALFDLDGVIFNSEPQYTEFWSSQFRRYYPGTVGLENQIKGQTLVEIYDAFFASVPDEQPKITQRLNDFEQHMHFDYIDGFRDYISFLRGNGFRTAVVTSSNQDKMNNVYRSHPEFRSLFDAILTSEDFSESKPSPDCYLRAAARFGVKPESCIVYEDSFNGLKSGRAAGMFVVGLSTTNSAESISPYCDKVIHDYVGLEK